ncbi:MAG TPA: hypothetical protein PLO33_14455 [Kouleothrix sp.]|uniref:general stress protein n=1 Tax=Kouleothrix sp. TaxID=2779161 RepID=UPI002CF63C04|nr:hypothetical protein [Kouleothrix sp.]HRC76876.1 hypothetical protein [Kouleothrix sp.]
MTEQDKRTPRAEGENRYETSDRVLKTDDPGSGPQGMLPNLRSRIVIGVFEQLEQAQAAVHELEAAGYPTKDVSLVMQQPGSAPEVATGDTKADTGIAAGVSAGAVIGGIAGVAALAIPGIGPLLAAGPLAAVLGALGGAALGGLVGSFTGLGIPTERAKEYEQAVRAGGIVVAVKADDRSDEERVQSLMQRHEPRAVHSYTQAL